MQDGTMIGMSSELQKHFSQKVTKNKMQCLVKRFVLAKEGPMLHFWHMQGPENTTV